MFQNQYEDININNPHNYYKGIVLSKILIDATAIPKQPVGAGLYMSRLVRELLHAELEFDLKILAHEDDFGLFDLHDEYKKHFLFQRDRGRGLRILSEQFTYPQLIRKNQMDLCHGLHYSMPIINKTRTVTTIHDTTFYLYPQKHTWLKRLYFKFFIKYSSIHSDHLITVSDNTKNDLISLFNIDPGKITTSHLGVDTSFKPLDNYDMFQKIKNKYVLPDKFILYVGLIEPRKNLQSLVKAYANFLKMSELKDNSHLVLAGRWGWESKELTKLITELNIDAKVHFPGYIDSEDLPFLYNMAIVFVYPSYYEGFGLPVLEAMACGTPVITSNISSMPEIVGDSGLLINPNDISNIENAIKDLLSNDLLRRKLSEQALIRSKEFTWKETAQKTLDVYRRVLKGE